MNNHLLLNGSSCYATYDSLRIEKGDGEYLIDESNKRYLDLSSGLWNVSLGYNSELNKKILMNFKNILDKNIPYIDMTSLDNTLYKKVATKLLGFVEDNNFSKVFYTNSGSESIEVSLKIVQSMINDSKKLLSFSESYHGTYYGGMSLSGISREIVSNHPPSYEKIVLKDFPRNKEEEEKFIKSFQLISNKIGAFFIEPVLGSAGVYRASINFYNELMRICKEKNIIIVFDEVATGFYKTGEKFFFKYLDYSPDIICLSKTINNGVLPVGAVLLSNSIVNKLNKKKIKHMSTQNGNLLGISSIYTVLLYLEKNEIFIKNNIKKISSITKEYASQYEIVIRNIGTLTSITLKEEYLFPVVEELKQNGILTYRYSNKTDVGLILFPHLNIDLNVYTKALKMIFKIVSKYK
ncbi:aminotransferase class III-fold pyridoxal phosphate-dependent enzyme [Staphylococcus pseudintermedius]|uniref:aminotransferase class III-fold pyridoxal phosphate-dependent enzyme n=1 Tax=Staphylococcus pseudintermedius TaxID=283734 RepID=UPI0015E86B02|nr:aminotransferase class III-fold pyridoxal phosphate-dependent enzyme [Staphylococcus pseudintermedius]